MTNEDKIATMLVGVSNDYLRGTTSLELLTEQVQFAARQLVKSDLLNPVILSYVDELEGCPSFDRCKNPLKDNHCDDHMEGSMYCFKEYSN